MGDHIKISLQAEPADLDSWVALARRAEASGFEALLVSDHPGSGAAPWPALGAAAAVSSRLRLGTYVLQAGVRDPVQVAADAATLDILAPGRVLLGLGAGHTFGEWESRGERRPSVGDRAGRFQEFLDAVARLLDGETVSADGRFVRLVQARLEGLPVGRVTLLVGGGHPRLLRAGAQRARVVALSGLGRTRSDGHRHDVRWSPTELRAKLDLVRQAGRGPDRAPEIEALVQIVTVTQDRDRALADLRKEQLPDVPVADLAATPFVLFGTITEMVDQLRRQADDLGITRYVVRGPAMDTAEQILARLAAHRE